MTPNEPTKTDALTSSSGHRAFRPTKLSVDDINLADHDMLMRPDLEGMFDKLRQERPVSWHQHPDSGAKGFWAVVRFDDIVATNRDTETFSSEQGVQLIFEDDTPRAGTGSMIEMDPPDHTRYWKIVNPSFQPATMNRIQDQIRARVLATLDRIGDRREFEVVEEFATPIALEVFYDLMGVPKEDQRMVLHWADLLFFAADPLLGGDPGAMDQAGVELQAYGRSLAERKRQNPGDDVMSAICSTVVDGEQLSIEELGSFFALLGAAGADTTRASIAWSIEALSMFDDQKQLWLDDLEGRAAAATEECLRWTTPTMHMRRTATCDTEIAGQPIRAGDKVALWFHSGNRDAEKFPDPYRFDITRRPNRHMAFGRGGPHFCLGAHLARLEVRIALTELLRHHPGVRATAPAVRLRSNFINAPAALHVET